MVTNKHVYNYFGLDRASSYKIIQWSVAYMKKPKKSSGSDSLVGILNCCCRIWYVRWSRRSWRRFLFFPLCTFVSWTLGKMLQVCTSSWCSWYDSYRGCPESARCLSEVSRVSTLGRYWQLLRRCKSPLACRQTEESCTFPADVLLFICSFLQLTIIVDVWKE